MQKYRRKGFTFGLRPWRKFSKIKYKQHMGGIDNFVKDRVSVPFNILHTHKKDGNVKPQFALNLYLMAIFSKFTFIDLMPAETMIILATSHVNGCDLMHMYLMEKMNSNYTLTAFRYKFLK